MIRPLNHFLSFKLVVAKNEAGQFIHSPGALQGARRGSNNIMTTIIIHNFLALTSVRQKQNYQATG